MNKCLFKQILKFIIIPAIFIAVALSNSARLIINQTHEHNHVIETEFKDDDRNQEF